MLIRVQKIIWDQTFTPLKALQRFSILSEFLYPQRLSFNRVTWQPTPTATSKLIPWYFLSFLCAVEGTSFYFILFQQILSHQKDPEISGTIHILLLMLSICYSFSSTICFTYHSNPDEICFVIRNTLKIKDQLNESSTLPGFFFHGFMSFIVMVPLGGFVVMIRSPKLDPTYLWFRNVTIISCRMKLFFRLCLYCSTLMHMSVGISGFAITGVNIIVSIDKDLSSASDRYSGHEPIHPVGFSLTADVMRKSAEFKKDLEFQGGYISYRKRQLRSLKLLKIWLNVYATRKQDLERHLRRCEIFSKFWTPPVSLATAAASSKFHYMYMLVKMAIKNLKGASA
ncbi:hypothetical protein Fcan01_00929 [Folsomia candida]|uniref:Uncharacterized protein n=1 Tax=Folsomia candida TaxID=158441 RepID=A0A226EZN1_FOLCA|nr:hypothetical protein Fcan01_00929 [Folsomia candida]